MSESKPNPDDDAVARAMREAEEAVERVRGGEAAGTIEVEAGPDLDVEIAALRAESDALRDKWLRSMADLENFKKLIESQGIETGGWRGDVPR